MFGWIFKKMPVTTASSLLEIPRGVFQPFEPLAAPVYLRLEKNQKYIPIKSPLDVFTPDELQRLAAHTHFYVPRWVEQVQAFREAGQAVRKLFVITETHEINTSKGASPLEIPAPSYELSNSALQLLAPLWGAGCSIEPLFLIFLVDEVCGAFPASTVQREALSRPSLLPLALLRSSLVVFMALHVGFVHLPLLRKLRNEVFAQTLDGKEPQEEVFETTQLMSLCWQMLTPEDVPALTPDRFMGSSRIAQKLVSRLDRMVDEKLNRKRSSMKIEIRGEANA
jgi:hypothetical protein